MAASLISDGWKIVEMLNTATARYQRPPQAEKTAGGSLNAASGDPASTSTLVHNLRQTREAFTEILTAFANIAANIEP
jgi:hypothetical protein